MGYNNAGTKFHPDLDIAEIAKAVRADLKIAFAECKSSVRIQRYSGGQSLNVTISAPSPTVLDIVREAGAEDICNAYNYNNSRYGEDFCDVNYHLHLHFEVAAQGVL